MPVLSFPWRRRAQAPQPDAPPRPVSNDVALIAGAFQALPDAVLIVGRQDGGPIKIFGSNAAARFLLRMPQDEDRLVLVLRHPEVLARIEDTLSSGEDNTLTYDLPGPRSKTLRVSIRALQDRERTAALVVMRDETETRRLEQMRVDFLANASHELRTPLASLAGFIETLQGHAKEDSDARDRFLEIMSAQAWRMRRLIDDLLSLSRIELSEHVPPSGACDLALVAREAADGLLPVLSARDLRVELSAPPTGAALVTGERDQLAQVLQNLIDNAAKYSPDGGTIKVCIQSDVPLELESGKCDIAALREFGGGRLTLLSHQLGRDNRCVRIRIADQGRGIAREHLPRLTERFYRVPGQKSGDVSGTGLGLAIVKHIVNRHSGALVVESAPGCGATFTVYLPAAEPVAASASASPVAAVTKAS